MRAAVTIALSLMMAVALQIVCGPPISMADEATQAMTVTVQHATRRCFTDRLHASGVFVAGHEIDVRADRDGLMITDSLVEPGDTVTKGQVLARLASPKEPKQEPVVLSAPVPGLVTAADAVVGAYTSVSVKNPLFRIAENGDIVLKAETLATNLAHVKEGMPAKIHVLGGGDIDGRVASVIDGIDAKTQLGTLVLAFAPNPRLRIGGFARVEIEAGQDCGLALPLSAVLFAKDGAVVATVDTDRVVRRRVTVGLMDGGDVEIRDGVASDDLVVARAAPFLRDGDHVRPVLARP